MGGRPRTGFRIICRERGGHRVLLGPGMGHCHLHAGSVPGKGMTNAGCRDLRGGKEAFHCHSYSKNQDKREIQKAKEQNRGLG